MPCVHMYYWYIHDNDILQLLSDEIKRLLEEIVQQVASADDGMYIVVVII